MVMKGSHTYHINQCIWPTSSVAKWMKLQSLDPIPPDLMYQLTSGSNYPEQLASYHLTCINAMYTILTPPKVLLYFESSSMIAVLISPHPRCYHLSSHCCNLQLPKILLQHIVSIFCVDAIHLRIHLTSVCLYQCSFPPGWGCHAL